MLPSTERLLLGPGPSPVSSRVLAALSAPPRSHLDPDLLALLDDIRTRLTRIFSAPEGSAVLAVSGTGTTAMEAAVSNMVEPGRRALAIVTGYFGDRLAAIMERHGAEVTRLNVEWGRAVDPGAVIAALEHQRYDIVSVVHAETSTGVRNPIEAIAPQTMLHGAILIVDAVTSLGALPLRMDQTMFDVCYSCSQKGLGAPPGLSPIVFGPRALERRVSCRNYSLDLTLLEDFWMRRKYHHTISSPLVYALATALAEIEEEGLGARWARHESVHRQFVEGLAAIGLSVLPPEMERLWNLNAVVVPEGCQEAKVRAALLGKHSIEVGAGLGPLAGRVWRVGLMGSGATSANVERLLSALPSALQEGRT
ncbi:MAG TPA: alanine--glyoxylate aminotransferase family protein [Vicinamibacterales bacterium]|nr:alanine--glyoxylate aminotransferase family protein [Vicinamibacterales bacterium]